MNTLQMSEEKKLPRIHIIVGSVMGTTERVAEACAEWFNNKSLTYFLNKNFTSVDLVENDILLICTSNTGVGDLPQNIMPFYIHLTNDYPRLANSTYGIINLGDSSYPSFGQAGKRLNAALQDLGAVPHGEMLIIDATEDINPEEQALSWLDEWIKTLPNRSRI